MAHALYECIAAEVAKAANLPGATFYCLPFDFGHHFGVACTLPNGKRIAIRREATGLFAKPTVVINQLGAEFALWGRGFADYKFHCAECGDNATQTVDGSPLCEDHGPPCPIEEHREQRAALGLCERG